MYVVNAGLLKDWLKKEKKNNPTARRDLLTSVRISDSLLSKILYCKHVPNEQTRFMLAHITGIKEELLFPPEKKEEEAA